MGKDFAPDSRCLGGASRIREEWCNMSRKIATARPQIQTRFHQPPRITSTAGKGDTCDDACDRRSRLGRPRPNTAPSNTVNGAAKLSQNRALRKAALGGTKQEHVNNVYHMHRRINDQKLPKERRKNVWDYRMNPVTVPQQDRTKVMVNSTSPWLPTATLRHVADPMSSIRRPLALGTCPRGKVTRIATTQAWTDRLSSPRQHDGTSFGSGTGRGKFGTRMGLLTAAGGDRHTALRHAFRDAIFEDVVTGGIVDDAGLQRLFERWVQVNPAEHRPALADALNDVQVRLDTPL